MTVEARWTVVPDVAGYRLYARVPPDDWEPGLALAPTPDPTPGVLAALAAVDLVPGATAEFAVTAYAANGSESALSNVISVALPTATGGATPSPTPAAPTVTETATATEVPPTATQTMTALVVTPTATASATATSTATRTRKGHGHGHR